MPSVRQKPLASLVSTLAKDLIERLGGQVKRLVAGLFAGNESSGVQLAVPYRMQLDGYSCGLCCARMVAGFHGVTISADGAARFTEAGTYTTPMVQLLRDHGLIVRVHYAGRADIHTLISTLKRSLPVIVSLPGHYLVATGFGGQFVYVHDPSPFVRWSGRINRHQFQKTWTREAIIVLGQRASHSHF